MPSGNDETHHNRYQFTDQTEPIEKLDDSMTTRVLLGLDKILRDKVNVQVEEFHGTLDTLLDEQFHRIKHLIRLSTDFPPQQAITENLEQTEDYNKCKDVVTLCEEEDDKKCREADFTKSQLLLQLCTYANIITNTLIRRQEFRVS